jgi:hypothetical protein
MARRRSRSRTAAKFMVECLHALLHLLAALILWEHSKEESKPARRQTGSGGGAVARCCAVSVGAKSSGHLALGIISGRHVIKERPALMDCVGAILQKPIPLSLFYRSPDLESYQIANNPTGWRWRYVRR